MYPIYVVDAFTEVPFKGNPAGVCILPGPADEQWMKDVAAEMKHAETAFLWPLGAKWSLRWLTPEVEVDLCGHATLASAHALWEHGVGSDTITFETRSGDLTATRRGEHIELNFPALATHPDHLPEDVRAALGVKPTFVGKTRFDYFIEVATETEVRELEPDHAVLAKLPVRGIIVTTRGTSGYDIVSRFFAPGSGVPEDPVTGSAHCALAVYWAAKLDKTDLRAYQASPRGGELHLILQNDRVRIQGQAVTILKGQIREASCS